ncbi:MAG: class D beta-lactamase [Rickettsiales bacterium]|nr:class D beta-lactamase [Rickettsiales bacterium]
MSSKNILFLLILLVSKPALANVNCFLVAENGKIIEQNGDCKTRHTPCSTFKIAISLMGYDQEFLVDETHPEFPFKPEYIHYSEMWKRSQNPTTWMKYSVVWYSQIITQKLGKEKFSAYVKKFNYGNQNVFGDEGKNNGLTESWLDSSLKISPEEQVQFLQKLLDDKLSVSAKAQQMTRNILFVEELPHDWKLYGKTGSCGSSDDKKQNGWFVGWVQKEKHKIIFANYLEDEEITDYSGGKIAKEQARKRLIELIKIKN